MIRNLCSTLAGNKCDYLTVTSRKTGNKKGVVISAWVHPGESVGSWMMKGVMDFITDPYDKEAQTLWDHYIFKIIPMLNPDGVINGNYRCSLAGCDLNRWWKTPSKVLHPTIYHLKKLIVQMKEEWPISLFCDLHGHSWKKNVFMYGCNYPKAPEETRIFPFILGKLCPYFNFHDSWFGV